MMNDETEPQCPANLHFIILHSYFFIQKWWVASEPHRVLAG
jgi:hypothetical protein